MFFFYIFAPFLLLLSPNYEKIFDEGYKDAIIYIKQEAALIHHVFPEEDEKALAVSIVFPELIRYSFLEDYFQETVNRILYVNKGEGGTDFSVGRLQMKPSFIEALESYVKEKPVPVYYNIARYTTNDAREIRKERIQRLNSKEWQWLYLKVFLHIADERFGHLDFGRFDKKLKFFATLYNHNFLADKEAVMKWSEIETYPYGVGASQNQYNYAQLAIYFYIKDWSELSKIFP